MGLQLVHRTNYRGKVLSGRCGDADTGGLELLWTQAVYPRDDGTARPCCFGFGKRSVWVTPDMLRTQHESIWELWHVGSEDGYTAGHRFHKFVLMPRGADEEETEVEYSDSDSDSYWVSCPRHAFPDYWSERWELVASGRFRKGLGALDAALPAYYAADERDGYDVTHCHVGVLLPYQLRLD